MDIIGWFKFCEHCWYIGELTFFGVKLEPSFTMYHWDGKGEDPNRQPYLCRRCAVEHAAFWDDMWSNVPGYGGHLGGD